MKRQLTIWPLLKTTLTEEIKEIPYRNASGELLPWEEPEYLEKLKQEKQNNE